MERLDFVGMRMIMPTRLSIKREISRLSRQSAAIAGRRLAFGYLLNREDGIAFWKQASDEMPQVFYSFDSDFLYRDDLSRFFFGKERLYGQEGLRSDRASTVPFSQPFIDSGMVEKDCPLVLSAVLPYAFLIDLRRIPPRRKFPAAGKTSPRSSSKERSRQIAHRRVLAAAS